MSFTRITRFRNTSILAFAFTMLFVGTADVASAQSKPYWVTFQNTANYPVRLAVTAPSYEDLGTLRPGEATEIDFNFNERVQIRNARSGQILQTHVVRQSTRVNVAGARPGNPNPGPVPRDPGPIPQDPDPIPRDPGLTPGNLQTEIRSALRTVNAARAAQGKQPFQHHPLLQQAAERRVRFMVSQTRTMNDVLHTTDHFFNDPATGQRIGMNKWVREAGYRLSPLSQDTANNVESTYGEGSGGRMTIAGSGAKIINTYLGEGTGGGHYRAMMSDNRDFAFAVGLAANNSAIVACVLVSSEHQVPSPADPGLPFQAQEPIVTTTGTGQPVVDAGPQDQPESGTTPTAVPELSLVIENRTSDIAEINFTRQRSKGIARIPARRTMTIQADRSSPVQYSAGTVMGQTYLTQQNQKLFIDGTKPIGDPITPNDPVTDPQPGSQPGPPSGKPVVMQRTLDRRGYYNNDNARYYNYFSRNWVKGRLYKVTVESAAFSPVVLLRKGASGNHAIDTNPLDSSRATIQFVPTETKMYSIHVTSKHQLKSGSYKITIDGE